MPDVASSTKPKEPTRLDWVGMNGIVMLLAVDYKSSGKSTVDKLRSVIDCHVDLAKPNLRGIHMSRMYLSLTKLSDLKRVNYPAMVKFSKEIVAMQEGGSTSSLTSFSFNLCVRRESLVSGHQGWLDYPVRISMVNIKGKIRCQIDIQIVYSSTCPCSAALSRQLVSERFNRYFKEEELNLTSGAEWLLQEEKLMATPHSQRSIATIGIVCHPKKDFPILDIINQAELAIKTSVQAVVKREDEQVFASINGENLMFCEDAARILLEAFAGYKKDAISVKICHLESLHAHNATAEVTQGKLLLALPAAKFSP